MLKRLTLILCCLLALAMPVRPALGTGQFYYNTAAGNPPSPLLLSFRTWLYQLLSIRQSDVPLYRATIKFIDSASTVVENSGCTPSDSNDGNDGLGLALSGASYTGSTATLTKTNGFSNYTWSPGNDWIYLTGTGWTSGLYQILSKTDNSDVVLNTVAGSPWLAAPTSGSFTLASSSGPYASYTPMQAAFSNSNTTINETFLLRRGDKWRADQGTNQYGWMPAANQSATVASGGTGYNIGDVVALSGGTQGSAGSAKFNVATVSGTTVLTVTLNTTGYYSSVPSNAVSTTHVTGSGTGLTLNVSWLGQMPPSISYLSIGAYGVGPAPWNSHWSSSTALVSNTWVQVSGPTYSIANPEGSGNYTTLAWIRDQHNPNRALEEISNQGSDSANLTLCEATPWSWCLTKTSANYDTLNVNFGYEISAPTTAVNPNTAFNNNPVAFEYNTASTNPIMNASGAGNDNILIQDQDVDGWGQDNIYPTGMANAIYTIQFGPDLINGLPAEIVLKNVYGRYGGYHIFGASSSGGCMTCINCVGEWTTFYTSSGETVFINFDSDGLGTAEFYDYGCWVKHGTLPSDLWIQNTSYIDNLARAQAFYGHVLSGTISLGIRFKCTVGDGTPYPPTCPADWGGFLPSATTLSQVRGFVVDEKQMGMLYAGTSQGLALGGQYAAVINTNRYFYSTNFTAPLLTGGSWQINSTATIDQTYGCNTGSGFTIDPPNVSSILSSSLAETWINSAVLLRYPFTSGGSTAFANTSNSTNLLFENSIIQAQGLTVFPVGNNPAAAYMPLNITNSASYLTHNAYGGQIQAANYTADPGAVTLGAAWDPTLPLDTSSVLNGAGINTGLQYDANWARRPATPSIGPVESIGQESFIPVRSIQQGISPTY